MDVSDAVRRFWNEDARTYNRAASHAVKTPGESAAWSAALIRSLPAPPARVLDVGAGTGFLSIPLARLGYEVTALDLSTAMLDQLRADAEDEALHVTTHEGRAEEPPPGPFDAVTERHLLWTLPDAHVALRAWASVAGRLVVVESMWGRSDAAEARRQRLRELWRRLRGAPPPHHASYDAALRDALPLSDGAGPDAIVEAVEASGWRAPALTRLHDVEWLRLLALPPIERLFGTTPQYLVVAVTPPT